MKVFYDCAFVERGRDLPIQLVSIGLIAEDGREFYGINEECLSNVTRHPWLSVNVAPFLPIHFDGNFIYEWDHGHAEHDHVMALDQLAARLQRFLHETPDLELWAYYGAYDHVVMCQLFGSMAELPSGIPMFTHELMQLIEIMQKIDLPPTPENTHHAMADARWVKQAYQRLTELPE